MRRGVMGRMQQQLVDRIVAGLTRGRSRASGLKQFPSVTPVEVKRMLQRMAQTGWRRPHFSHGAFLADAETMDGEYNLAGEGRLEDLMEGKVQRWSVFGIVNDRDAEAHISGRGHWCPTVRDATLMVARELGL